MVALTSTSTAVQFYSDTAWYPLREKDGLTLKKNYVLEVIS